MTYTLYKTIFDQDAVMYVNEQGQMISFILGAENPEEKAYLAWVAEGNTPLPADEVTQ
jgi:hypothetical protein